MNEDICIFKRVEKKYMLSKQQMNLLLSKISDHLTLDEHGKSTVMSIYLDTPDFLLIRNSIEAKTYKEKLRLRSYGVPDAHDKVFMEIKKKFKGVVYKRRVCMDYCDALEYIKTGKTGDTSQIMQEIDTAMKHYGNPQPGALIAYEREAYFSAYDPGFRITFDANIRYNFDTPEFNAKTCTCILPENTLIMEVKTNGGMPLWMSRALDELKIYPTSFSKYGTAYKDMLMLGKDVQYA